MQFVILAGGLGTRLRPVTLTVPKPMVPVLGKPFLLHQLEELKRQGVRRALLLIGHLGDRIRDYFGGGESIGMELDYSQERELLGTGGALKLAEDKILDDFFVIYGDSFLPIRYAGFEAAFRRAKTEGMIAVYRDPAGATRVAGNVALSPENLIARYDKNSTGPGLDWVEAGVLAFSRGVLRRIPPGRVVSLERDLYPALIREGTLAGYPSAHRFFDIGTEERIRDMEAWLKR
ncbi:MAG: NTP transferase domain-containing protein [Candidatus Aureabacteria bacterium]|nr:NTP transferase domain-containing protein [Candidatus Auribacterota bacterium]HOE26511.1 sugar phosphate nucleotidyltransferase [bacterium]HQM52184.1 sugar phosphate nucleotidyltransferase [bacterium]